MDTAKNMIKISSPDVFQQWLNSYFLGVSVDPFLVVPKGTFLRKEKSI